MQLSEWDHDKVSWLQYFATDLNLMCHRSNSLCRVLRAKGLVECSLEVGAVGTEILDVKIARMPGSFCFLLHKFQKRLVMQKI